MRMVNNLLLYTICLVAIVLSKQYENSGKTDKFVERGTGIVFTYLFQKDDAKDFHAQALGQVVEVLFEKPGRKPGQIGGKSPYLHGVHCDGPPEMIGKLGQVEIIATGGTSLQGRLLASEAI